VFAITQQSAPIPCSAVATFDSWKTTSFRWNIKLNFQIFGDRFIKIWIFLNLWLQIPFDNYSEALEAGKRNDVWGVIHFGHNFTEEFEIRRESGDSATYDTILRSQINVRMDSTSRLK
jgi:hypothetical protein